MRNLKVLFIALLGLSLFAACAKDEAPSTTSTAPAPTSVDREPEVLPPPQPTEAAPAETQTVPDATTSTDSEPAPAPTTAPASASSAAPAPMLPRRGASAPASPASEPATSDPVESQRITIADAYEIVRAGNGVLVDVRTDDAYKYQRIPGSIHMPLPEMGSRASELPQDKWIITYCTCPAEESSGAAATTLKNMGFERVAALLGGMQGWRGAGLPVEFGQ